MSRTGRSTSPHLEIPRKSVELEDSGTRDLSSEDEHFSDASEGQMKRSRPQTPVSPIPRTRVERIDDEPAYGEVPGTPAYEKRARDAVPDEVEVVPTGRLSKRSSQYLEPPTTPGGSHIPRTVVEKIDPSSSSYGDDPDSRAFKHRKADSVPDLVLKAPDPGRYRQTEDFTPSSASPSGPIPETIVTRFDSRPAHGEVSGTDAYEKRKQDAEPDILEEKTDLGSPTLDRTIKHSRQRSTLQENDNEVNDMGDEFDDFEEGDQADDDDDFGDFDDTVPAEVPVEPTLQIPDMPPKPLIDVSSLSSLPDLLAATEEHLDDMFPSTMTAEIESLPKPPKIDLQSPIFPSERSRSLWKQLVTPPPLQPPNWTQSRIRRLFLVSLGVPVDLDEILPPSKQKKLILPDINLEPSRKSESDKQLGSIARLKQEAANDSTGSLDSTQSGKEGKRRRTKGPPPPPDVDLVAVKRLCTTTKEKIDGMTDTELKAHVKHLESITEKTSELLEYWLQRRDGLRKEKEAFEGVIENLVAHVRRVRK